MKKHFFLQKQQKKKKKGIFLKFSKNFITSQISESENRKISSGKPEKEKHWLAPPQTEKKYKKGDHFFRFSKFSLTFCDKKYFFCHQKVTKLCSENFENRKKWSCFFFLFGGGGGNKKKFSK